MAIENPLLNLDALKYGFFGFAVIIAALAIAMFQDANERGVNRQKFKMFVGFLIFAAFLALLGLVSQVIPKADNKDREKLESVQRDLQEIRGQIAVLLAVDGAMNKLHEYLMTLHVEAPEALKEIHTTLMHIDTRLMNETKNATSASGDDGSVKNKDKPDTNNDTTAKN